MANSMTHIHLHPEDVAGVELVPYDNRFIVARLDDCNVLFFHGEALEAFAAGLNQFLEDRQRAADGPSNGAAPQEVTE